MDYRLRLGGFLKDTLMITRILNSNQFCSITITCEEQVQERSTAMMSFNAKVMQESPRTPHHEIGNLCFMTTSREGTHKCANDDKYHHFCQCT